MTNRCNIPHCRQPLAVTLCEGAACAGLCGIHWSEYCLLEDHSPEQAAYRAKIGLEPMTEEIVRLDSEPV